MSGKTSYPRAGSGHLDLLVATSQIGIWDLDVITGVAQRNAQHDKIFGYEPMLDEWSSDIFLSHVLADDRERVGLLLSTAVAADKEWSFETSIIRADGEKRWISAKGRPKFNAAGEMTSLIGHLIDITDTKRQEERLTLLTGELNHRMSNTVAIVRSMIRLTANRAGTVDQFAEVLGGRLEALTQANRLLMAKDADRVSVGAIIAAGLEAFGEWKDRVSVEGDKDIVFDGETSEAFALIFHELLTNAIKHGALSNATGRVRITVLPRAARRSAVVDWVELGGPAVSVADGQGFGTKILENALRGHGQVTSRFAASGLSCQITVGADIGAGADNSASGTDPSICPNAVMALTGARVLLVEDEPVIGMDLAMILSDFGAIVDGPHATVEAAMERLESVPDVALLDINLRKTTTEGLAVHLREIGVPFVVLSGATGATLPAAYEGAPLVEKPCRDKELAQKLAEVLSRD